MTVITKPETETLGTVAEPQESAPVAAPERERQAGPGRSPRRSRPERVRKGRGKAIAGVLALASGLGVGIGFAATSDGHTAPVHSSDVAACSLLSGAQVSGIVRTPLAIAPTPTTTSEQLAGFGYTRYSAGDAFAQTPPVAVLDTCRYQPRFIGTQHIVTSVLPVGDVYLNQVFGEAADHTTRGVLTLAPLTGVGQQAAIGRGQIGNSHVPVRTVYARVGSWFVEVDTAGVGERTTVALAQALAGADRLEHPPAFTR